MDRSRLEGLKDALERVLKRAGAAGMDQHFVSEVHHLVAQVNANLEDAK